MSHSGPTSRHKVIFTRTPKRQAGLSTLMASADKVSQANEEGNAWDPEEFTSVPFYPGVYASGGQGLIAENESEKRRKNKGEHNVTNGSGMNMGKRICNDMVRPSNVITGTTSNIHIAHPAVYPTYFAEFFVKVGSSENMTVGDMFMGSGTTALACMNTNRNFIGIELEEEYYEIAKKRVEEKRKEKDNEQQTLFNEQN